MAFGNEHIVAVVVILGICGVGIYRLVFWVMRAPRTVDPWGKEIEDALNQEQAVPLCPHCLAPQEHNGWFCPECGATVGPYCNYLPFVYVFSEGEVFRAGVTQQFRRSNLIACGFVLMSLIEFAVFAPIYWFFLFRNLRRRNEGRPESPILSTL